MAKTIPNRLLNRLVTISALTQTKNASGDVSNTLTVVATHVPMRIGSNKRYGAPGGEQVDEGLIGASTHEGFCLPGVVVKMSDVITDESDNSKFTVNYVNDSPGGIKTHHMEIFMTQIYR